MPILNVTPALFICTLSSRRLVSTAHPYHTTSCTHLLLVQSSIARRTRPSQHIPFHNPPPSPPRYPLPASSSAPINSHGPSWLDLRVHRSLDQNSTSADRKRVVAVRLPISMCSTRCTTHSSRVSPHR